MPRRETEPMNERVKFIARYLEGEESVAALRDDFEVSRKARHKRINPFEEGG